MRKRPLVLISPRESDRNPRDRDEVSYLNGLSLWPVATPGTYSGDTRLYVANKKKFRVEVLLSKTDINSIYIRASSLGEMTYISAPHRYSKTVRRA